MSYIKHILLPSEQVLYDGHVHPTVLLSGLIFLGIAALILTQTGDTGSIHSMAISLVYFLGGYFHWAEILYYKLEHWQMSTPSIDLDLKLLALAIAGYGFIRLLNGLILMETTELIVTDQRVIAKTGVMTITTVEMDRRRIAGVTVHQSLRGRIMGYGYVYIQGFTTNIGNLPPMVNPHLVEKFVQ